MLDGKQKNEQKENIEASMYQPVQARYNSVPTVFLAKLYR